MFAQHLGDGEDEIGRRDAFPQFSGEAEADHFRDQHGDRLAEHRRFRFDAADTPTEHGKAVDHRGVTVGADQRIGESEGDGVAFLVLAFAGPHRLTEIFEIDLMADTGAGRHHAEIVEGLLAPAQEGIALAVAFVLDGDILLEGVSEPETVHHHRVIDDEIHFRQGIDLGGVAAHRLHRVAHGGKVDDGGHAREILHQHARRPEGDLALRTPGTEPGRHRLDVFGRNRLAVLVTQEILKQHLHRIRQSRNAAQSAFFRGREAEIDVGFSARGQRAAGFERIEADRHEGHL